MKAHNAGNYTFQSAWERPPGFWDGDHSLAPTSPPSSTHRMGVPAVLGPPDKVCANSPACPGHCPAERWVELPYGFHSAQRTGPMGLCFLIGPLSFCFSCFSGTEPVFRYELL